MRAEKFSSSQPKQVHGVSLTSVLPSCTWGKFSFSCLSSFRMTSSRTRRSSASFTTRTCQWHHKITKFQLLENKCNIKTSINTWHHSWGWLLRVIKIIFPIAFFRFALTCLAILQLCMYFALGLSSSIHYLSFVIGFAFTTLSCNHYFNTRICTDNQHYNTLTVCLKGVFSRRGPWDTGELNMVFTLHSKPRVRNSLLKIQTSSNYLTKGQVPV